MLCFASEVNFIIDAGFDSVKVRAAQRAILPTLPYPDSYEGACPFCSLTPSFFRQLDGCGAQEDIELWYDMFNFSRTNSPERRGKMLLIEK